MPDALHSPEVRQYIAALQEGSHQFVIDVLPPGVGGQTDGRTITLATSTAEIGSGSIQQATDRIKQTQKHEIYHVVHGHTQPKKTVDGIGVIIAGQHMKTAEVIEALTVTETGNMGVSREYLQHEAMLHRVMHMSNLSLTDVRDAIDSHDLTRIDDRTRGAMDSRSGEAREPLGRTASATSGTAR